jgi:hypothetical protein
MSGGTGIASGAGGGTSSGTITIGGPLGRAADASSVSVSLSTEDVAILNGSIPAGNAIIGQVSIDQTTPGTTNAIQNIAATTGGASSYVVLPGASDNHANIKNGAGMVYSVQVFNNSATINYIRLYNAASGFNGCNSATNLAWSGQIPASTSGAGATYSIPVGLAFSTGISICVTSGYGNTDTTNATNSALQVNVQYK